MCEFTIIYSTCTQAIAFENELQRNFNSEYFKHENIKKINTRGVGGWELRTIGDRSSLG